MNINRSKISIIGCGWLGLPLAEFLIEKGFEVNGSTTSEDKLPILENAGIHPFLIKAGAQLEGKNLREFFSAKILIINIPPGRRRTDVENLYFTEVKNILDAAQQGNIQKVIFCSSSGVYADNNKMAKEDDLPSPQTDSTKALVKIENHLRSIENLESTILRFAGLIGGSRKPGRFLAGKKNLSNGNAPINLVHRKDCINIIHQVIHQNIWNEIFNVCAEEHPLRKDFYTEQALKLGLEPPTFLAEDPPFFKIVSNTKVKQRLGLNFLAIS